MKPDKERRDGADPEPAVKRLWRTPQVIEGMLAESEGGGATISDGGGRSSALS